MKKSKEKNSEKRRSPRFANKDEVDFKESGDSNATRPSPERGYSDVAHQSQEGKKRKRKENSAKNGSENTQQSNKLLKRTKQNHEKGAKSHESFPVRSLDIGDSLQPFLPAVPHVRTSLTVVP
jgi:hypothetical protein